jgi:hypothetical protein
MIVFSVKYKGNSYFAAGPIYFSATYKKKSLGIVSLFKKGKENSCSFNYIIEKGKIINGPNLKRKYHNNNNRKKCLSKEKKITKLNSMIT